MYDGFSSPVASVQACKVLANIKLAHFHHGQNSWCSWKPNLRAVHHYLHFCRHGHAAVWKKLCW